MYEVKYDFSADESLRNAELPNLTVKWKNDEGSSIVMQKKKLKSLEKQLAELEKQEETQYELLETKKYSEEVFDKRNKIVRSKIELVSKQIEEVKRNLPKAIDYEERIATLNGAIDSMLNPDVSVRQKNILLKSIIERIELTSNLTGNKYERDWSLKIKLRI